MDQRNFTEWQPRYSVGNYELDNQHKKILSLCRQSIDGIDDNSREGIVSFHLILNDLAEYADRHFKTEEALLAASGYPLSAQHIEEHLEYRCKLTELLFDATSGRVDKDSLQRYLAEWWYQHILTSDMQYAKFIRAVGR